MEFRYSERKGREVCEELRMRMIDVCCLQEVRWRGQGARMLWWSGRGDGFGGVGLVMKEELCEKVVVVRRVSDDSCSCFLKSLCLG